MHKKNNYSGSITDKQLENFLKKIEKNSKNEIKWFIGVGLTIFSILAVFFVSTVPSKSDMEKYNQRYDPIFRNVLLDKAYMLLSDVHLTEVKYNSELLRNLEEVTNSLNLINAFDNRNQGLLKIMHLIQYESKSNNKLHRQEFLSINPTRDQSLNMNPQESAFFITFQGLVYLKYMRETKSHEEYDKYLSLAKEKFKYARQLNPGISNLWNGLGICILEEAHSKGKLQLIGQARDCFAIAYELHRSPINFAAEINNLSYANLLVTFYNSVNFITNEGGLYMEPSKDKNKLSEAISYTEEQLESF